MPSSMLKKSLLTDWNSWKYSDNVGQPAVKSQENGENLTMVQRPSSFKNALPLAAAVLLAALIIAAAMAMIFL